MALGEVLAARANKARATAQVECGSLGTVTVEALSLRDLEKLSRAEDADRAVFYAACRELQGAGAELLRAGRVYRPDQVTEYIGDAEARAAAEAVRGLSGASPAGEGMDEPEALPAGSGDGQGGYSLSAKENIAPYTPKRKALRVSDGQVSGAGALASRQSGAEERVLDDTALPLSPLALADADEAAGAGAEDGQVSHESWALPAGEGNEPPFSFPLAEKKTAARGQKKRTLSRIGEEEDEGGADRVLSEQGSRTGDRRHRSATESAGAGAVEDKSFAENGQKVRLAVVQEKEEVRHDTVQEKLTDFGKIRLSSVQDSWEEIADGQVSREFLTEILTGDAESDKPQVLWSERAKTPQNVVKTDKTDSGFRNIGGEAEQKTAVGRWIKNIRLHENESEFGAEQGSALHENESEIGRSGGIKLHENESDFRETLHENKSEYDRELHEIRSEIRKMLHENKSELAELAARELLEGLRRASWVR